MGYGASSSSSAINISGLRSDLSSLNANYERECNKIRSKFEEMRTELTRKENDIINDLTEYTNQCRSIIDNNISKMETLSKSVSNNGYSTATISRPEQQNSSETESKEYVKIDQVEEEKESPPKVASSGIDYSGSKTGANN